MSEGTADKGKKVRKAEADGDKSLLPVFAERTKDGSDIVLIDGTFPLKEAFSSLAGLRSNNDCCANRKPDLRVRNDPVRK